MLGKGLRCCCCDQRRFANASIADDDNPDRLCRPHSPSPGLPSRALGKQSRRDRAHIHEAKFRERSFQTMPVIAQAERQRES